MKKAKIFVSAGEASSDMHCAQLVSELKKQGNFEFLGLGGDKLAEQGCTLLLHNREFSVGGGPSEILSKIPLRARFEKLVEKKIVEKDSDIVGALLVDNGEINLRLASLFHFFKIPVVYYIPPKVWVWRHSRIEKIYHHVKLVLGILPFETEMYKNWEIPFEYVGNPLLDEVNLNQTSDQAKQDLGLNPHEDVVAVFCGSRHNEVRYHLDPFAKAIQILISNLKQKSKNTPVVVLPCAPAIDPVFLKEAFTQKLDLAEVQVVVVQNKSHSALKAAQVALVKSGTSTLEAGLLQTPQVLAYQSSRLSTFLYKHVVRYRGFVGLVNLFLAEKPEAALGWEKLEEPVVPELILEKCNPEKIAAELFQLYFDENARKKQIKAYARLPELLSNTTKTSPAAKAAELCLPIFNKRESQ